MAILKIAIINCKPLISPTLPTQAIKLWPFLKYVYWCIFAILVIIHFRDVYQIMTYPFKSSWKIMTNVWWDRYNDLTTWLHICDVFALYS